MANKNFNKKFLDALAPPKKGEGRRTFFDAQVPGMHVRVASSGLKAFSILYRDHSGKQHRASLGRWPRTTVKEARDRARKMMREAAEGRFHRRDTVEEVARKFVAYEEQRIKNWRKIERVLANHVLPEIGDLPIRDVGRADVTAILDGIMADGKPGACREVRKHLHHLFEWAWDRELIERNPAHKLRRKDPKRPDAGRALLGEELRAVWSAAVSMGYPFGDLFRLLILTGQRRGDWSRAGWTEIEDGMLVIPAERYKSRREHLVPLSEPAQEIVDGLKRQSGDYLFSTLDGRSPVLGMSHGKKQLDRLVLAALRKDEPEATLARYRVHDFRVTVETGLASLGVSREVRDAVLGHARPGLQKIYNKHDYLAEKRSALDAWAAEAVG